MNILTSGLQSLKISKTLYVGDLQYMCDVCSGLSGDEGSALGKLVQAAATSFFTHAYASVEDKDTKVLVTSLYCSLCVRINNGNYMQHS